MRRRQIRLCENAFKVFFFRVDKIKARTENTIENPVAGHCRTLTSAISSSLHCTTCTYSSPKAQHGHDASTGQPHGFSSGPYGSQKRRARECAGDGELTCGKPQNQPANSKHSLIARRLLEQLEELQHALVRTGLTCFGGARDAPRSLRWCGQSAAVGFLPG